MLSNKFVAIYALLFVALLLISYNQQMFTFASIWSTCSRNGRHGNEQPLKFTWTCGDNLRYKPLIQNSVLWRKTPTPYCESDFKFDYFQFKLFFACYLWNGIKRTKYFIYSFLHFHLIRSTRDSNYNSFYTCKLTFE